MKAKKIVALLLVLAMLATSVATATIVSAEETYVSINDVAYEVIGGTYTTAGVVTDANLANVKFEQGVSCDHNTLNGLNNPNNAFDYSEAYAALPADAVANFYFDPYAPANTDVNATSTVKFEVPDNATELTGIIALCNRWSANGNRFNTNGSGNYYMDNGGNYLEIVAYSADGVQLGEYTTDPLCKGLKYADEVAFNEAFKNAADVYGSDEIAADLAITDANDGKAVLAREFAATIPEGAEYIEITANAGIRTYFDHMTLYNTQFTVVTENEPVEEPAQFVPFSELNVTNVTNNNATDCDHHTFNDANALLNLETPLTYDSADMHITPYMHDADGNQIAGNGTNGDYLSDPVGYAYHTMLIDIPFGATSFTTTVALCDGHCDYPGTGTKDMNTIWNDPFRYTVTALDAEGNAIEGAVADTGAFTFATAKDSTDPAIAKVLTLDVPEGAKTLKLKIDGGKSTRWDHIGLFNTGFTVEPVIGAVSMLDAGVTHVTTAKAVKTDYCGNGGYGLANATLADKGVDVTLGQDNFDMFIEPAKIGDLVYHIMQIDIPAGATSFSSIIAMCNGSRADDGNRDNVLNDTLFYSLKAIDADGNQVGDIVNANGSEARFYANAANPANYAIVMAMDEIPEGAVKLEFYIEAGATERWDHIEFFDSKFEAEITYDMVKEAEEAAEKFAAEVAAAEELTDVKDKAVALAQARLTYERMTSLAKAVDGAADAKADLDALTSTEFENQWKADAAAVTNYIPFEAEAAKIGTKTEIFYQESGFAAACDFDTGETAEFTVYAAEAGNYYLGVVYGYNDNQQRACDVIVNGDTYYASEIFAKAGELDVSEITNTVYFAVELKEGKNTVVITKAAVSPANMPDIDKILVENIDGSICNVDIAVNEGVVDGTTITWSGASIEKDDSLDLTYLNGTSTLLQRINNDISETVDYGIIYGVDEDAVAAATDTASTDAGKLIAKKVSFGVDNNGDINRTFGVKMTNVAEGTNPVVKFYVTYKDTAGTEHTIYSDVVGVAEAATPGADE